jgi:hypothetical protein
MLVMKLQKCPIAPARILNLVILSPTSNTLGYNDGKDHSSNKDVRPGFWVRTLIIL